MSRRLLISFAACCWFTSGLAADPGPDRGPRLPAGAESAVDALAPASSGGAELVDRALARLSTHRRVLMIAAHPDDEDTFALAHVTRAQGGEAAYLSLTRGDGGQNLIGDELGVGLGLLRSRELESARGIDGARQFFSRAYDFGYTRSLDETLERWPLETLVADTLRVVRRFAPQIVVAIFPPDERAGHGQHQASAVVAAEVFERSRAATDAAPNLTAEGLEPWPVAAYVSSAWWNPEAGDIQLDLGEVDPWSGRSIYQLALASRSRHRCQDMGFEQPPGEFVDTLSRSEGGVEGDPDLFSGIDTSLAALADGLVDTDLRQALALELEGIEELARGARAELVPSRLDAMVEPLAEIVRRLDGVERRLAVPRGAGLDGGRTTVRRLVAEKLDIARDGLAAAAGLVADAIAERPIVVQGGTLGVRSLFWNSGDLAVEELRVDLVADSGIEITGTSTPEPPRSRFATQLTDERRFEVAFDASVQPTVPYFLQRPRLGDLYDWSDVDPDVATLPFAPPALQMRFRFTVGGAPMELLREVVFRTRDQAIGEVRRPVRVVPAVEVAIERDLVVWPLGRRDQASIPVVVRSNRETTVTVSLAASLAGPGSEGWTVEAPAEIGIDEPMGRQRVELLLRAPDDVTAGRFTLSVQARHEDATFDRSFEVIDYPHIRPVVQPVSAVATVASGVVDLPDVERVGYVRGASDRVPEALVEIGLPIELLDARALDEADLSGFDAVIIGSRAYEVEPALVAANARLLDYVHDGGLLIVQYQQYGFARGQLAPRSLTIARPHGRVTDETAAVTVLDPEHPVFRQPNTLAAADWDGWVQERGLYFADTWDDHFTPLIALADPGQSEQRGALLVTPWGSGTYVYTGLAFFRQLPAGAVGAYRLMANLLALDASD